MRKTFVSGLITLGAGTAALGTYILVYRPWEQHWGATDTEVARPMAGDDLVDGSLEVTTRAVTVNAAPEYIWPWLMQMGNNRGGLYSYDWLDRKFGQLDRPSVDRVLPEFQHLKEGDVMPYARTGGMLVKVLEPNRAMLLVWQGPGYQVTQSWGLYARDRQHTRLVIRVRAGLPAGVQPSLKDKLTLAVVDPLEFVMTRKQLLGIKERAERLRERAKVGAGEDAGGKPPGAGRG